MKSSTGTQNTDYQFAGQSTDATALQYLRARYYDPTSGRILSRDSWSNDDKTIYHPYAYARNNPATVTDPSGHCTPGAVDPGDPNDADCLGLYEGGGQETYYPNDPTLAEIIAADEAAYGGSEIGATPQSDTREVPPAVEYPSDDSAIGSGRGAPDEDLGRDPARGGAFSQREYETAKRLEAQYGLPLERDETGDAEWISGGKTYDAVGNFDGQYLSGDNLDHFLQEIGDHLRDKADVVVVDVSKFSPNQIQGIRDYVNAPDFIQQYGSGRVVFVD